MLSLDMVLVPRVSARSPVLDPSPIESHALKEDLKLPKPFIICKEGG